MSSSDPLLNLSRVNIDRSWGSRDGRDPLSLSEFLQRHATFHSYRHSFVLPLSSYALLILISLRACFSTNRPSLGSRTCTVTTCYSRHIQVITQRAKLGEPASDANLDRLAFDLFADRVLNYIGSYYLKLGGEVDALVFSGGIGERSKELRAVIGERVQCLGFARIDESKNEDLDGADGVVFDISLGEEEKKILVCRTDEQVRLFVHIISNRLLNPLCSWKWQGIVHWMRNFG